MYLKIFISMTLSALLLVFTFKPVKKEIIQVKIPDFGKSIQGHSTDLVYLENFTGQVVAGKSTIFNNKHKITDCGPGLVSTIRPEFSETSAVIQTILAKYE
jgi:hypothetical protein